jgi:hypothetical protein
LKAKRPDIQFSVCLCTCFQASPRTSHRQAVKHIFRYLRYTLDFSLWYSAISSLALHGFSDVDFAGCRLDRKSTSGTCQFFFFGVLVFPQTVEYGSITTKAEYVAATSCCFQLLWITYTMSDFGEEYTRVPLLCDSTSAISVAENLVLHFKTNNIEVRCHFLRDNVERGIIALIHVPTHDQLANILTKPLHQQLSLVCGGSMTCVSEDQERLSGRWMTAPQ